MLVLKVQRDLQDQLVLQALLELRALMELSVLLERWEPQVLRDQVAQ